jgi:hypothetical protein
MREVSVSRSLFGSAAAKFQGKESIEVNNPVHLWEMQTMERQIIQLFLLG